MCLTSKTLPVPCSSWELACLLPLFHPSMTSFLPKKWEDAPPQTWSRLSWFLPWKLELFAGPGGRPLSFWHCPAPVAETVFSWALPRDPLVEEFQSLLLIQEDQTTGDDSGFPQLRQKSYSFSVEFLFLLKPSSLLSQKKCVFIFLTFLTVFGMSQCLIICRLEVSDWIFVQVKKYFSDKLLFNRIKACLQ